MHDPDHRTNEEKLAELEQQIDEQDRKEREHADWLQRQLRDPEVVDGIRVLAQDWIKEQSAKIAESLSNANAAQLHRLALRLTELDLLDLEDDPDGEIEIGSINDLVTGEIIVAIAVDGSTYWEHGRDLIEQREAAGRTQYRHIGVDGEPGPWKNAPPPPSRASTN
jgi:hypothetical protein